MKFTNIIDYIKKHILDILALLLLIAIPFLFSACSTKEYVIEKLQYPKLRVYDYNKSLKLTAYNKGNKVCIKEWGTCIPKSEMIKLITYTHSQKKIIDLYKKEILQYNEFAKKHTK